MLDHAQRARSWTAAWIAACVLTLSGCELLEGTRLTLRVDLASVRDLQSLRGEQIRRMLFDEDFFALSVRPDGEGGFEIAFESSAQASRAAALLVREGLSLRPSAPGPPRLNVQWDEAAAHESAMVRLVQVMTERASALGSWLASAERTDRDEITVTLPAFTDPTRAQRELTSYANLELRLVHTGHDALEGAAVPDDGEVLRQSSGTPVLLERAVVVTSAQVVDASSGIDGDRPAVYVSLDAAGTQRMSARTRQAVGRPMAALISDEAGAEVVMVAIVREALGKRFNISGMDSIDDARRLASSIRTGALPVPVRLTKRSPASP